MSLNTTQWTFKLTPFMINDASLPVKRAAFNTCSFFCCAGAMMENLAQELLGVNKCSFLPQHNRNLSNEFRCFVNYPSVLLSSWSSSWSSSWPVIWVLVTAASWGPHTDTLQLWWKLTVITLIREEKTCLASKWSKSLLTYMGNDWTLV